MDGRHALELVRLSLTFVGSPGPCVINQDLAHDSRCDGEQVHLIRKARLSLPRKLEIHLVNEGCSLQCVIRALCAEMPGSDPAQVSVQRGGKLGQRYVVAGRHVSDNCGSAGTHTSELLSSDVPAHELRAPAAFKVNA